MFLLSKSLYSHSSSHYFSMLKQTLMHSDADARFLGFTCNNLFRMEIISLLYAEGTSPVVNCCQYTRLQSTTIYLTKLKKKLAYPVYYPNHASGNWEEKMLPIHTEYSQHSTCHFLSRRVALLWFLGPCNLVRVFMFLFDWSIDIQSICIFVWFAGKLHFCCSKLYIQN